METARTALTPRSAALSPRGVMSHPSGGEGAGSPAGSGRRDGGSEYEFVLCVKPDVHVYRIPPWATNRGYR